MVVVLHPEPSVYAHQYQLKYCTVHVQLDAKKKKEKKIKPLLVQ